MTERDLYLKPVAGFRTWRMNPYDLSLEALVSAACWPKNEPLVSTHKPIAGARRFRGDCEPGEPCDNCGIWAFSAYESVCEHRATFPAGLGPRYDPAVEVRGLVAGWGTVKLATKGWRAGKAYPLALFEWTVPPSRVPAAAAWHYAMHRIARRYTIPVVSIDDAADVIAQAGAVMPSEYGA